MNNLIDFTNKFGESLSKKVKLSNYSWFNLGGNAEFFFKPKDKTELLEFLAIKAEKLLILNFGSFFSPAAYKGQTTTKLDFLKHFENSFFNEITLEYLWGSNTLIIFLF